MRKTRYLFSDGWIVGTEVIAIRRTALVEITVPDFRFERDATLSSAPSYCKVRVAVIVVSENRFVKEAEGRKSLNRHSKQTSTALVAVSSTAKIYG